MHLCNNVIKKFLLAIYLVFEKLTKTQAGFGFFKTKGNPLYVYLSSRVEKSQVDKVQVMKS